MSDYVIEVATFKLKPEFSFETFSPIDEAVGREHVSRQPGFISREAASGENGAWLVIVHWQSVADADASMASFQNAPAAAAFMEMVDPQSMSMVRYDKRH